MFSIVKFLSNNSKTVSVVMKNKVSLCYLGAGIDVVVDEVSDGGQRKLKKVPMQSVYSDSDAEESREQCRARMVCTSPSLSPF